MVFGLTGRCALLNLTTSRKLAELWLNTGSGLAGDLDGDNDIDFNDLSRFTDYWLAYCPYGWDLK